MKHTSMLNRDSASLEVTFSPLLVHRKVVESRRRTVRSPHPSMALSGCQVSALTADEVLELTPVPP